MLDIEDDATYDGTQILPEESFLRRLPTSWSDKDRIRIDALVFSADALTHSFATLKAIAGRPADDPSKISGSERTALFLAAWSIVDHVNTCRQILKSLLSGPYGPNTTSFFVEAEAARILRNQMDHLNQNASNVANAKGMRSPIFGSLSYFLTTAVSETEAGPEATNGFVVLHTSGQFLGGERMPFVNPAGRRINGPVDCFKLDAFGSSFDISRSLHLLQRVIAPLGPSIEEQIVAQINAFAAERNETPERLLAHFGGSFTVALAVAFDTQTGAATIQQ